MSVHLEILESRSVLMSVHLEILESSSDLMSVHLEILESSSVLMSVHLEILESSSILMSGGFDVVFTGLPGDLESQEVLISQVLKTSSVFLLLDLRVNSSFDL